MKIGVLGTGMVDQPVVGRLGFEGDVALRLRDFITERGLVHGKCSRGDDRVTHEGGVGVPAGESTRRDCDRREPGNESTFQLDRGV